MYVIHGKRYGFHVERCGIHVENVWNLWKKVWNPCGKVWNPCGSHGTEPFHMDSTGMWGHSKVLPAAHHDIRKKGPVIRDTVRNSQM